MTDNNISPAINSIKPDDRPKIEEEKRETPIIDQEANVPSKVDDGANKDAAGPDQAAQKEVKKEEEKKKMYE